MNSLRLAFRQLRKSPAFTFIAVLTLSLGIGANTAIFSVVYAVLLSPLPYPQSDRILVVRSRNLQENIRGEALSPAGFRELEKQATSFESVAASRYNYDNLTRVEKPTSLTGSYVTQNYFRVLGEKPLIGRTFAKDDAAGSARPTVVLSYDLWQKQFGGRRDLVGQTITLDDVAHEVVGVMPHTFKDPYGIAMLWRVLPNEGGENFVANSRFWSVIGRTKPGVPVATVEAELQTIAGRFAQSDPRFYKGWELTSSPLHDEVVGNYREGLLLVVGAALLVLLITCANVAGLQFVRAAGRQREVAIRLALGASRIAIARERLIESLLLVALGGIGGVIVGSWSLDLLLANLARDWIPRSDEIALNTPVLLITGAIALCTGLLFGLYPAWHATRVDAINSLRDGSKGSSGLQSVRLRGALVVAQIALTLVLLVCAGLVWKSFATIMRVNPGIEIERTLSMVITLAPTQYDTNPKRIEYYRQLLERTAAVPGVEAAAFTQTMPFTWGISADFQIPGSSDDAAKLPSAYYDSVSPSFFTALHVPLLLGRTFLFALLALLLAGLGLYGLIAYSVAQRGREFGIRYALGPQIGDVLGLVIAQAARLTALGLALGLFAAAAVARLMQSLLFHTTAYDPMVFGGVAILLAVIGLLAVLLPALRATKANPATALRAE